MPKGEKDLRQFIKGKLRTQIDEVWRRAESYHDCQKGDNIQGRVHCETVETNLSRLIPDEDINVKRAGVNAFLKISGPGDHEILLALLAEQCQGWSYDQMEIFKLLSEVDKRLYCPYYDEEKE